MIKLLIMCFIENKINSNKIYDKFIEFYNDTNIINI